MHRVLMYVVLCLASRKHQGKRIWSHLCCIVFAINYLQTTQTTNYLLLAKTSVHNEVLG